MMHKVNSQTGELTILGSPNDRVATLSDAWHSPEAKTLEVAETWRIAVGLNHSDRVSSRESISPSAPCASRVLTSQIQMSPSSMSS